MKYFIEKACYIFSKKVKNPMTTIILRPGNLYGPYDKFDPKKSKVIPSLIRKILSKNKTLEVWGDGKDIKDFLYIEDMCDFIVKNLNKFKEFDIINVCSSKQITINQIIKILFNIIGSKKNIIHNDSMPSMIPKRIMSNNKAVTHYNLKVRTSMHDGLQKTLNWYKNK
jgi:GDP-L-fucose synthase